MLFNIKRETIRSKMKENMSLLEKIIINFERNHN